LKINFNVIILSTLKSSNWSVSSFPTRTLHAPLLYPPHTGHTPLPSHSSWLDYPNVWWEVRITKLLIMQFSATISHFFPLTYTKIQLSGPFFVSLVSSENPFKSQTLPDTLVFRVEGKWM
jgi:hypothetical protein